MLGKLFSVALALSYFWYGLDDAQKALPRWEANGFHFDWDMGMCFLALTLSSYWFLDAMVR